MKIYKLFLCIIIFIVANSVNKNSQLIDVANNSDETITVEHSIPEHTRALITIKSTEFKSSSANSVNKNSQLIANGSNETITVEHPIPGRTKAHITIEFTEFKLCNQPQAYIHSYEIDSNNRCYLIVRFDRTRSTGIETFFDNFFRLFTTNSLFSRHYLRHKCIRIERGWTSLTGPRERQITFVFNSPINKEEFKELLDQANNTPLEMGLDVTTFVKNI